MYYLLLLLLIVYPFGQLLTIPLGIPSVSLYVLDIVAVACVASLIFRFGSYKERIRQSSLVLPLGAFVFFGALGLLLNPLHLRADQLAISSLYLLRFVVYASLYFVTTWISDSHPHRQKTVLYGLFSAGTCLGVFGIVQYFLYPNLRNLYYLGWDPHLYRLFSTLFDPNFTGIVLVLTILLGVHLWVEGSHAFKKRSSQLLILAIVTTLMALILTYSRSSYLSFIVGFIVLSKRFISWRWIVGGILVFVLILYMLPRTYGEGVRLERTSTIFSRIEGYQSAFTIIRNHPLIGVGFNSYRYAQRQMGYLPADDWEDVHSGSGTDNSFLFVWATTGIGGLVSFMWMLYTLATNQTYTTHQKSLAISSIIGILVHSFFVNSFFYIWVLAWLMILYGAVHQSRSVVKR